jgi:hypothetical protein
MGYNLAYTNRAIRRKKKKKKKKKRDSIFAPFCHTRGVVKLSGE